MQLQQVEFQTQLYCKGSVTLSNKFIYWTLESMYSVKQILTPSIFQLTTVQPPAIFYHSTILAIYYIFLSTMCHHTIWWHAIGQQDILMCWHELVNTLSLQQELAKLQVDFTVLAYNFSRISKG